MKKLSLVGLLILACSISSSYGLKVTLMSSSDTPNLNIVIRKYRNDYVNEFVLLTNANRTIDLNDIHDRSSFIIARIPNTPLIRQILFDLDDNHSYRFSVRRNRLVVDDIMPEGQQ